MRKKAYIKPSIAVEEIEELCQVNQVSTGGTGIGYGGGGTGPAHAPQIDDVWDEDDEVEVAENNPMGSVSEYIRQSKLYNSWED